MADLVTVKVAVNYVAFPIPRNVAVGIDGRHENDWPTVTIETLEPAALEALAKQWLDHLYAACGRASPFKLTEALGQ